MITQFVDPFGRQLADQNTQSEIDARKAHTALDLYELQALADQARANREYLKRTMNPQPQPAPGSPQQPKPSASEMILSEVNDLDKKIQVATDLGLNAKVDQLTKQREATMGRYSLAANREDQARDRAEREQKEKTASVARFASGANEVLMDDKMSMPDKVQALQDLENGIRQENPMAYKVLAGGKPEIDWTDKRTWNRMRALESQAIDPAKRQELALNKQKADEQARKEEAQIRRTDAMIAAMRESGESGKPPAGMRWANAEHTEMEPIPVKKAPATTDASGKALHGEEYLKSLPEDEQGLIKGIADGKIDPKTLSTRGGHREEVLKKVTQYRPDFNQAKYEIYKGVQKDFTSGKAAGNVTAINTAIGHAGTMEELGEAMKNKDTQALNSIYNRLATAFGDPRINNFQIAASALSSEMMRVFRQVGASEVEQKDWEKRFGNVQSPEQLKGAVGTAMHLLKSRIESLDDQWKRGMDSKQGYPDLISPRSEKTLEKFGVTLDRGEPEKSVGSGKSEKDAMNFDDYLRTR